MDHLKDKEIELRFLVKGKDWKKLGKGTEIRQGFISSHFQRVVRVRVYGEKTLLTIKGEKKGDENPEFEWEIPKDQAIRMLNTPNLVEGYIIRKIRYTFPDSNIKWNNQALIWEIDEFLDENEPLQIAEIELKKIKNDEEKEKLKKRILANLLEWIGERLDFGADPTVARYFNNELSKRPFSFWDKKEKELMLNHL